jgi:mannose-6-phosphate isomerase-like protein (cupin superfamily)
MAIFRCHAHGSSPDSRHTITAPDEQEVLEAGGNRLIVKVATPSQFVCDYSAPPHFAGPPLHVHPGFDETFLVLEGRVEVTVRDQQVELTAGGAAFVSGAVPHTFSNLGADRTRFLLICTPGGFEDYFRGIATGNAALVAAAAERVGYRSVAAGTE